MNSKAYPIFVLMLAVFSVNAQTPNKEALNNFALYSKNKDFSYIEKAKKIIDEAYKTKRDSASPGMNLVRAMVYSTLSVVDNTRKLNYVKEPADEALFSLECIDNAKFITAHKPEITYCEKQISNGYLALANTALASMDYLKAFSAFKLVDSLSPGNTKIKHNLAIISERLKNADVAEYYYEQLISDKYTSNPDYILSLSGFYELNGKSDKSVKVLKKGAELFPKNKDILFKIINIYMENKKYSSVTGLIDEAINLDYKNANLYYLAGFSYEQLGNISLAEKYYKKILAIEPNNYDGNYALGLLYLHLHLINKKQGGLLEAEKYLTKAEEVNANAVDVLKCLAILYNTTGETTQAERINNKLNQILLNN